MSLSVVLSIVYPSCPFVEELAVVIHKASVPIGASILFFLRDKKLETSERQKMFCLDFD